MSNFTNHLNQFGRLVIKRRLAVMLAANIFAIISETIEHYHPEDFSFDPEYPNEIIIFALLLPIIGFLLLELMKRILDDQQHTVLELHEQKTINQELSRAKDWDELVSLILQIPHTLLPVEATALWLQDITSTRLKLVKTWGDHGLITKFNKYPTIQPAVGSGADFLAEDEQRFNNNQEVVWFNPGGPPNCYSLSLKYNDQQIGILQIVLPAGTTPSDHQLYLLADISQAMALAMHVWRLQHTVFVQNKTIETTRRRIAHDLHDILGQDLAYLRYKLETFSHDSTVNFHKDFQRMQIIAEEAYAVVRGTISSLETGVSPDLISLLPELAQTVSARAGFEVRFFGSQETHRLPSEVELQVTFIYREILNNIEKHAGARQVLVRQQWTQDEFILSVSDDGRGFEPSALKKRGHFGLAIMQERANEIDGSLVVVSHPGEGTKITLRVPLVAANNPDVFFFSKPELDQSLAGKTHENFAG